MTYKPSFALSPMNTISLIGWEAQQLAEYIAHPPTVQGPDGNLTPHYSPEEVLRRVSLLYGFAQDVKAFADEERARVAGANGNGHAAEDAAVN